MSETSKPVRKQTVTLTIGPKTAALVETVVEKMTSYCPGMGFTTTGVLGMMVVQAIEASLELWKLERPEGWTNVLD